MKYAITAIALAALSPLAACGGGSGSVDTGSGGQPPPVEPHPEPKPEPVTIQSLTGMAAPAETVADQYARANDIIPAAT